MPAKKEAFARRLRRLLLSRNFDFSGDDTTYPPHALHPFPAKFPPQLVGFFVEKLTRPGQLVLDPMVGSGTVLVECQRLGRNAYGFDVDPLAILLARAKTRRPVLSQMWKAYHQVATGAEKLLLNRATLARAFKRRFGNQEMDFLRFWFPAKSRRELLALVLSITEVSKSRRNSNIIPWLWLLLSSIIITKEPGVSLARDLSHSRPHRSSRSATKSPLNVLEQRFAKMLDEIDQMSVAPDRTVVRTGIADCRRRIPLSDNSVDLIVTSPPYAAAIDYLRTHKFSLVWMGYALEEIAAIRKKHIGAAGNSVCRQAVLSPSLERRINLMRKYARRQARCLERYFSDLALVFREMYRVLKPGRPLIMVVAPSSTNGRRLDVHRHLGRLLEGVGFEVCGWAQRRINRDKRMLPISSNGNRPTRIERRMHREYILGAVKPTNVRNSAK